MTSNPAFGFALEYVDDVETARRFYVDVLGLEVEREHPTYVQFKDAAGSHFAVASDGSMDGRNELELHWLVDDAEIQFKNLSRTAEMTMPLREMRFGKVFGIKDPAGQPRYLLELAKHRPNKKVG